MTNEIEEQPGSLIRRFPFQSFMWNEEQIFFPARNIKDTIEFFQFFKLWQQFEEGRISARKLFSSRPQNGPFYVEYFFSSTSDTERESERDFEERRRLAVVSACERGYPSAAFARYVYCHDGMYGFEENKSEALHWLQIAAQSGHYRAMQIFGLYLISIGKDLELAESYIAIAKYYLGVASR